MGYEYINVEISDQLGIITINRPKIHNSLNVETLGEISDSLSKLENDEKVGCIIFTGSGDKAFVAGADINQLEHRTAIEILSVRGIQELYNSIENCTKPTIAMINGYALGGGFELAMSCDIRIASTNAKMGLPELNLSIIPAAGGTQRLARIVGKGKALELILTGKMINADEAYRIGLVAEVVEIDQLRNKTEEYASQILSKGPLAVKLAKIAVNMGTEINIESGLMIEKLSQAILLESEDKQEGTRAFREKRKPNFIGR